MYKTLSLQFFSIKKLDSASFCAVDDVSKFQQSNCRLIIIDKITKQQFLIDTGAEISVLPPTNSERKSKSDFELYAANSTPITTYGKKTLELNLGLRRSFSWQFTIADVDRCILGADFLKYYSLLVDIKNKLLIDSVTTLSVNTISVNIPSYEITTLQAEMFTPEISNLLNRFKSVLHADATLNSVKHNVVHFIETSGPPVTSKVRRLNKEKLGIAKAEIDTWLTQGICRPSKSNWSSPIHLVQKKDGKWRLCGDYRGLNEKTKPDRYPIPFVTDFTNQFAKCNIFSTLDLIRAYHQVPINDMDIEKTAICTPFGLFEFPRMTFGLRNAAQTFQRLIHSIFHDFRFVFTYIDDLLIASKDHQEHLKHLELVFSRLMEAGLVINLSKCVFAEKNISFLGFDISAAGITPTKSRVDIISKFTLPQSTKALQRFLGMVNYYRFFLPHAAEDQMVLYEFLKGKNKKENKTIQWTDEAVSAFEKCKTKLSEVENLAFPNIESKLALMVDASDNAVGAVVQQFENGRWRPLSFFSKKLTTTEKRYSTYDRELFAAYVSVRHFKHFVEGREFILFSDHKPLTYALKQNLEKASPRQRRHLDLIAQYTSDIRHISGKDNVVADALSRIDSFSVPSVIDFVLLAEKQEDNEELFQLMTKSNFKFEKIPIVGSDKFILCDVSTGVPRPFVPDEFRRQIFNSCHELSHPGIRSTCKLVRKKFLWKSMNKDVRMWAQSCAACQKSKVSKHVKSPVGVYPLVSSRFSEVHLDIVGRLPVSENKQYCITLIDRFTRWPEAIPTEDCKAKTVAEVIVTHWISRFGVPHKIVTDRGPQFESELFLQLSRLLGFQHNKTTAYNPASNGMIERWHRSFKAAIMCKANQQWTKSLPLIMLGLRTAFREDLESSSAELVYGENLRLPSDFIQASTIENQCEVIAKLRSHFKSINPSPASRHSTATIFVFKDLHTCSHVWIRTDALRPALQPPYEGPYPVISRNEKYFTLLVKGNESKVSINRLKPCFVEFQAETTNNQSVTPSAVTHPSEPPPKPAISHDSKLKEKVNRPKETKRNPLVKFEIDMPKNTVSTSRSGRSINRPSRFE